MCRKIIVFLMAACAVLTLSLPNVAFATEKYMIKEMTPGVQSALEGRRNRFDVLAEMKRQGQVGENNQGYVTAFSEAPDVTGLVALENKDRKIIYLAIAQQNNLKDALGTIEKVFAQTQRGNAEPGDKIQAEDGSWGKK